MIIDWTSGAIQQLPTAAGLDVWTWSGVSAAPVAVPATAGPDYTFPRDRQHYTFPEDRRHHAFPLDRKHYVVAKG